MLPKDQEITQITCAFINCEIKNEHCTVLQTKQAQVQFQASTLCGQFGLWHGLGLEIGAVQNVQ